MDPLKPFRPPRNKRTHRPEGGYGSVQSFVCIHSFWCMVLTLHVVGEITDHDVAIMEKGYKWMIYTPPVRYARYKV